MVKDLDVPIFCYPKDSYHIYSKCLYLVTPYHTCPQLWTFPFCKNCWMDGKQCGSRSDVTFCGIWSGSTLIAQACLCKNSNLFWFCGIWSGSHWLLRPVYVKKVTCFVDCLTRKCYISCILTYHIFPKYSYTLFPYHSFPNIWLRFRCTSPHPLHPAPKKTKTKKTLLDEWQTNSVDQIRCCRIWSGLHCLLWPICPNI